jgi:hypothetical protein
MVAKKKTSKKSAKKSTTRASKSTKSEESCDININAHINGKGADLGLDCCGSTKSKCKCNKFHHGPGIYCLGFLGSAIYYISTATGFWNGVWGVIKSIVWPAIITFQLMRFLGL